jgi:hypothetical protein
MKGKIRMASAAFAGTLALLASASPAGAVTVGQLAPGTSPPAPCISSPFDLVQPTVTSGNTYEVPQFGATITSWSHNAAVGAGQMLTFKVFRPVSGLTFQQVAHDGPRSIAPSTVNTFSVNLAVKPGDLIGLNDVNATISNPNACFFAAPGDTIPERAGNLADGESGLFDSLDTDARINLTAEVKPSNAFGFAALTRNKKKGVAFLAFDVPGPGQLALSGKGVKRLAAGAGAHSSLAVTGPGIAKLKVKATGKKRAKLLDTGKVKVITQVTYTPTGGDPNTLTRKVKLKKNL